MVCDCKCHQAEYGHCPLCYADYAFDCAKQSIMSKLNEPPTPVSAPTESACAHVRDGVHPPITVVIQRTLKGAPTRADDLNTETKLCLICSGYVISTLQRLEKSGEL
jgi:hypothetical protein